MNIGTIWGEIKMYEGQIFKQVRGGEFTYKVVRESIELIKTDRSISKKEFLPFKTYKHPVISLQF